MEKILIIEDNRDLNAMLVKFLQGCGYETQSAYDGIVGEQLAVSGECDLILLDIMLPYKSGDQILTVIRRASDKPVIVISAKDMVGTKIDLLKAGADDYITKPFDLGELEARIVANLRQYQHREAVVELLTFQDIEMNLQSKTLSVGGTPVTLTAKEFLIMELFLRHQEKIFSKSNIYETVWGMDYLGDDSAVKSHLSRLRAKLKEAGHREYIETVWGMGYRLYKE